MCAAIVQLYHTYYLYYLVILVSSNLCAAYLYYFAALKKILYTLTSLTNWCQPPLPDACRPSIAHGGAPVTAPANVSTSIPPPYHFVRPSHIASSKPIKSYQPAHKSQFIRENPRPIPIRSSQYNSADTIQPIGYR